VENLPDGPGLIIYYHAPFPIDYIFFLAKIFFLKKRLCCYTVVDQFVFKLPGLKMLGSKLKMITGSKEECLHALKNGNWLAISPGGTREAIFSDKTYKMLWGKRKGFAKVALEARVVSPTKYIAIRMTYRLIYLSCFLTQCCYH
uniref:Phospholipid/glycerol acyltransferase domain-containing protein n=1 Tax=Pseudonaja textilis TaxID=8673 RepID=A0A670XNY6_PSETE